MWLVLSRWPKSCNLRAWPCRVEISFGLLSSVYGLYSLHHCPALLRLPSYLCNCFWLYLITKTTGQPQQDTCWIKLYCQVMLDFCPTTLTAHPLQHIHRRRYGGFSWESDLSKKISMCFLLSARVKKSLCCALCLLYIFNSCDLHHGKSSGLNCWCTRIRP